MIQTPVSSADYEPNAKSKALFKKTVFEVCPQFRTTTENTGIINEIYFYAHGRGKLDPKKGILLWGEIGAGKSTLMKILAEYQRKIDSEKGFKCVNCGHLAAQYSTFGAEALNESTWNESYKGVDPIERGFDELGREPTPAKYYGSELNVMQYVLQIRYDLKVKTHCTTNLTPETIGEKYGIHIMDRAVEMFNFIKLEGESLRK
jgi:energy-coupling factor transporter ATP-binding protein EcfA2